MHAVAMINSIVSKHRNGRVDLTFPYSWDLEEPYIAYASGTDVVLVNSLVRLYFLFHSLDFEREFCPATPQGRY